MTGSKVANVRLNKVVSSKSDAFLGARIAVCDDDTGRSYQEGTIVGVEKMYTEEGLGEYLRVMVDRRVVEENEEALLHHKVVMVDVSIPMRWVKSLMFPRRQAALALVR